MDAQHPDVLAVLDQPGHTARAFETGLATHEGDAIPGPPAGSLRADRHDHARGLVPHGHRGRHGKRHLAVDEVQVGGADPARLNPHQQVAGAGLGVGDVLDLDGLAGADEPSRLHAADSTRIETARPEASKTPERRLG